MCASCVRKFVSFVGRSFRAARIVRVPIAVAVVGGVLLILPPQTQEVFRVVAQDLQYAYNFQCVDGVFNTTCPHFSILREAALAYLGLIGAALAIWYWARRLASQFWPTSDDACVERAILRGIPVVLACGFLMTAAWGFYSAIPFTPGGATDAVLKAITERKAIAQVGLAPTAGDLKAIRGNVEMLILPANIMMAMAGLFVAAGLLVACLLSMAKSPENMRPSSRWERRGPVIIFLILVTVFVMEPVSLPQFVGSVGILGLFLICATAILSQLSALSSRYEIPLLFLLSCWVLLWSWSGTNNDHAVELAEAPSKEKNLASPSANRPFNDLLREWYMSRPDRKRYVLPKRYPLYIVAAQGGGIYAAYDTARLLGVLQDRCAAFGSHTFAISGVSGGSVGASVFVSLLKLKGPIEEPPRCQDQSVPNSKLFADGASLANRANKILDHDLLSPLIAGLLFGDVLQSVLPPDFPIFDRARALDRSLENAFDTPTDLASGGPTSTQAPSDNPLRNTFASHWHDKAHWPALFLNTTDVRTGERKIMAPFDFGGNQREMLPVRGDGELAHIKLSTAAFLSARFPWVTPSAWFRDKSGNITYLVDGGYYDNSGLVTAQELMQAILKSDLKDVLEPKLIILTGAPVVNDPIRGWHEPLDPIRAMLNSWGTRPVEAIHAADQSLNISPDATNTVRIVRLHGLLYSLPLGWRLSGGTVYLISAEDPLPGQCRGDGKMIAKTNVFHADCLLQDLEKELL